MNPPRISDLAIADLDSIWDYLAQFNVTTADRLIDQIYHTIERIVRHPGIGRGRDDLEPGLRSYTVDRRYLILYLPVDETIEVRRILDGRRDVPTVYG